MRKSVLFLQVERLRKDKIELYAAFKVAHHMLRRWWFYVVSLNTLHDYLIGVAEIL
jgi:hypothetical protein